MARETRSIWTKRVERWRTSGLTARQFAAEIGVNAGTLTFWKWKLGSEARGERRKGGRPPTAPAATFVELVPTDLPRSPTEIVGDALEIVLGGGLRIRVPARFDDEALRRVVAVLGGL